MATSLNLYFIVALSIIAAGFSWNTDVRRRKLRFNLSSSRSLLSFLDVGAVSIGVALAVALLFASPHDAPPDILFTPATLAVVASVLALMFLWSEGKHQVQLQRPAGIIFAEGAILLGIYKVIAAVIFHATWNVTLAAWIALPILVGTIVLGSILPAFLKGHEEHRILDRIDMVGEYTQSEYVAPTPECPYPDRWHMLDAQSAEAEVLDFLKSFILMVKPDVVLETGTFIGHSAMKMAEGMKANGFGKIITIEYDPKVFAKAKQNIDASGLGEWIEYRNASSLDTVVEGTIDILFSDSDLSIRESEIRRFLPQIKPRGLVLVHDSSSTFKVVRDAVLRLELEGLLSVVLLSTPRGMVIAQKREGRS
jgi:predicted O-methyltransferase YrrM